MGTLHLLKYLLLLCARVTTVDILKLRSQFLLIYF